MTSESPSSGIQVYLNLFEEDNECKMLLHFADSGIDCLIPVSHGQYKIILDCINKNFLGVLDSAEEDAPEDEDVGLMSGIRFMVPVEDMNAIYSSDDKEFRIIMINIDAQKDLLNIYRVSGDKKVESFDVPIGWIRNFSDKIDLKNIAIQNQGKTVSFGEFDVSSKDLVNWFCPACRK